MENGTVDWKLEVVVLPVSDVDRAKRFYSEQVGFVVDVDTRMGDNFRVVQMTPRGSACSVTIGQGLIDSAPGSVKGMQLVVADLAAAQAERLERGVEVSPIRHADNSTWLDGLGQPWDTFSIFNDPRRNAIAVKEN